jgi:quercetin dioxygenase-like cupin family protein
MTMRTEGEALFFKTKTVKAFNTKTTKGPKTAKHIKAGRGESHRGLSGLGVSIGACGALMLAGQAAAQPAAPLIAEPVAIAPGFNATMLVVNLPPAGDGPLTTAGQAGHRHPASTYAYVSKGAVVSRLGDGPERRFATGEAWSETPLQAHYIVNASRTEPAQLVVVQVSTAGTTKLTEPLPK